MSPSWTCDGCLSTGNTITIEPHGETVSLAVVKWPSMTAMPLLGMESYVCANHPAVEASSWGAIKALYGQGGP